MRPTPELALHRFLADLVAHVDRVRDADKALKAGLRLAREFFQAEAGCIAIASQGGSPAELGFLAPPGSVWEPQPLGAFLRGERPRLPRTILVARIDRFGRRWGALGLRRARPFGRADLRAAERIGERLSELIGAIDRVRLAEVRARIDRKLLEQLRPKDLFYQILHGLRSLTRYDHSAALFIHDEDASRVQLVAEQIAWRKGRSRRIGSTLVLEPAVQDLLEAGEVLGFDRENGGWREWAGRDFAALPNALESLRRPTERASSEADEPEVGAVLYAPLATRDGVLGALEIASLRPASLGAYQAELVKSFLPHAAVAVRNLRRAEQLENRMIQAEKEHAMANLARGVSHDIHNAFGAALPLVQQVLADLRSGEMDRDVLVEDLEQVQASLQTCRRIFGGMLTFARGGRSSGAGDLGRAIEATLAILRDGIRRSHVTVEVAVAPGLPPVRGGQGDLEQLVMNLVANARDAMPNGGELSLAVEREGDGLRLLVRDTGVGIPAADLERVLEPFFTTKRNGNGLGLSICRSIVWDLEGRMSIESRPGEGTSVTVRLPALRAGEEESR